MATSNQLVASRVSRNPRVSKGFFVTVKLLRIAKRLSSVATQKRKKKKKYSAKTRFRGWQLLTRLPSTDSTHQNASWPNNFFLFFYIFFNFFIYFLW